MPGVRTGRLERVPADIYVPAGFWTPPSPVLSTPNGRMRTVRRLSREFERLDRPAERRTDMRRLGEHRIIDAQEA